MFAGVRKKGGLGVLDLDMMNHALLTKWWWKFFLEPQLQWNKLIHDLYYRRKRPLKEGKSFRPSSYWWKGVLRLNEIFKWGVLNKLGYGDSIDFWSDRWCGEKTLQSAFPEIYSNSHCKSCKISDCLTTHGWDWSKIGGGDTPTGHRSTTSYLALMDCLSSFKLEDRPNSVNWRWSQMGGSR